MTEPKTDLDWMKLALQQAQNAALKDEVPVGAVLINNNEFVASGHNQPVSSHDPSSHAEIVVLRAAGKILQNYRLPDSTLYVTLEPCPMCVGAIIHARVSRVVFAASDPKTGAAGGCFNLLTDERHNQVPEVVGGVLAEDASNLIRAFFKTKR